MKIAYLLLVHHQPGALAKLVESLTSKNTFFFIHVDANADEREFRTLTSDFESNIHFVSKRVHARWGDYSIVEATLHLMRLAFSDQKHIFDYFILLSGQDFPIKPPHSIKTFLEKHNGNDFLEYFELPSERLNEKQGGMFRLNRFHYFRNNIHKEFPPFSKKPVLNPLFNFISRLYFSYVRKMPLGMKPYAGSQWWMLKYETVKLTLEYVNANAELERFFKNVWVPDEIFFQTVILHLNKNKSGIINNHYRCLKWEKNEYHIIRPATLTETDFPHLLESNALFARKFDEKISSDLYEKITKEILKNP